MFPMSHQCPRHSLSVPWSRRDAQCLLLVLTSLKALSGFLSGRAREAGNAGVSAPGQRWAHNEWTREDTQPACSPWGTTAQSIFDSVSQRHALQTRRWPLLVETTLSRRWRTQPWKRDTRPLWSRGQGCSLPSREDLGSPSAGSALLTGGKLEAVGPADRRTDTRVLTLLVPQ